LLFILWLARVKFGKYWRFSQYSQTCVQRPPLGPEKCGRYSVVVVTTGLIVLANLVTFAWVGKIILYMKKNSFKYKTTYLTLKLANLPKCDDLILTKLATFAMTIFEEKKTFVTLNLHE
jgi:hypothetical protein